MILPRALPCASAGRVDPVLPAPVLRRAQAGLDALRPLLRRLHFYVGVLVAPFVLVTALTGLAYVFVPQLDHLVYRHELSVPAAGRRLPLAEQVRAARIAHPEGTVTAVIPPQHARDTTQVVLDVPARGDKQRTVYVDPYTDQVRGALTTSFGDRPLTTWVGELHRSLHLGPIGRVYSETAASWLWVLAGSGLLLWLRRHRRARHRARSLLLLDLAATGRRRTVSWHASLGVWLTVGLFFLAATGLTWSRYAGARFDHALSSLHAHAPIVATTLPGSPRPVRLGEVDSVLAVARAGGLSGPVEIDVAGGPGQAWTVAGTGRSWPLQRDMVAVDPATSVVTARERFRDWPLLAQLTKIGIYAHMGSLFGLTNQIALAVLAVGIIGVIVLGYRAWWQRRPTRFGFGRPPARGTWRRVHPAVLVGLLLGVAALGWVLPVMGVELVGFVVVDVLLGLRARGRTPQYGNDTAHRSVAQ